MKLLLSITLFFLSAVGLSHPSGTYMIDKDPEVTVTFEVLNQCPGEISGALHGKLRRLSFSEKAEISPYLFVTGTYVEMHTDEEVYVETDDQCVPLENGQSITASRYSFDGFSLERIRR